MMMSILYRMLDALMIVMMLTMALCFVMFLMKNLLDYPGLLNFKCVYNDETGRYSRLT